MRSGGLAGLLVVGLLGGVSWTLLAPSPDLHSEARLHTDRLVFDARGEKVPIPLPFNGSVIYAGIVMPNYLLVTRDPGSIVNFPAFRRRGGLQDQLIARVFPLFAKEQGRLAFNGGTGDLEGMLASRPSALFTWAYMTDKFEALGLPAIGVRNTQKESEIFDCVRMYAQAVGTPERAKYLIDEARWKDQVLAQELGPLSETERPRVLALYITPEGRISGTYGARHVVNVFWARGGARNAISTELDAVHLDAERVLRLDPDVILLEGVPPLSPLSFAHDPKWSTLRAVRTHRVYRQPPGLDGFMWNIIDNPLYSRWLAELLHPDRVQPRLRAEMRDTYLHELGYQASDADLDTALAVSENGRSTGYQRFLAPPPASTGHSG